MLTTVLFDIDGTLILSGGAGARALDRVFFSLHGLSNAVDGIRFEGMTDPAIVREAFAQAAGREPTAREMSDLFAAYIPVLREEVVASRGFSVMPGIESLLEHLARRDDVLLGLVTGNVEPAAWIKLARPRLDRHFRFGGFGSDSEFRDHLTRIGIARGHALARRLDGARAHSGDAPPRAIVIGDTLHDIRAARAVGAYCVAVATGSTPIETLAAHAPDLLLRDLSDPSPLIGALEAA